MTLYRDPKSWNFGLGENYLDYIRRRAVAADITGDIAQIQRASAREIAGMVSDQTKAILLGMDALKHRASDQTIVVKTESVPANYDHSREIELLCQCFGQGIATLSSEVENISRGISDLNSTFQWGFGEILGSLGGIQDSLDKLIETLKKPSKNYSYEKFDDARDAFRQKLYPECLKLLDRAINGDHVSSGYVLEWRFHLLKGIIRLGSASIPEEFINLKEAEDAFLLAARYARADSPHEAAKAMMQAGWAAFAQHKLEEARKHTDEALALNPNLGEALYNAAKFAFAAGKDPDNGTLPYRKGIDYLKKAIDLDVGYIAKADTDGGFPRRIVQILAESKREDVVGRVLSCKQPTLYGLPGPSDDEIRNYGLLQLLAYESSAKEQVSAYFKAKQDEEQRKRAERERFEREKRAREEEQERIRKYREERRAEFIKEIERHSSAHDLVGLKWMKSCLDRFRGEWKDDPIFQKYNQICQERTKEASEAYRRRRKDDNY